MVILWSANIILATKTVERMELVMALDQPVHVSVIMVTVENTVEIHQETVALYATTMVLVDSAQMDNNFVNAQPVGQALIVVNVPHVPKTVDQMEIALVLAMDQAVHVSAILVTVVIVVIKEIVALSATTVVIVNSTQMDNNIVNV